MSAKTKSKTFMVENETNVHQDREYTDKTCSVSRRLIAVFYLSKIILL